MYNTTYKVPAEKKQKIDYPLIVLTLITTVAMFFAFAKAVDGPAHKAQVKSSVVQQVKG